MPPESTSAANDKTFILGLGAQKAATSWLYHYLKTDAAADFGALKEYRVWDSLEHPEMSHFDVRPTRLFNRSVIGLTGIIKKKGPEGWRLRGQLQQDTANYFDYFENLLSAPNTRITGDITPSYAGLSVATLEKIRDAFVERGIDVKAFFIMRDPVERAISAARMNRTKRDWREEVPQFVAFEKAILRYVQSNTHDLLANYVRTIQNARAVFGDSRTYFGFYENMFDPQRLERLSNFFGVSYRPERIKTRFYSAKSDLGIPPDTEAELRKILAPVYDFCADEFPETRALWTR